MAGRRTDFTTIRARNYLSRRGVEDADREAVLSWARCLGVDPIHITAGTADPPDPGARECFWRQVGLRGRRVPRAYLDGWREFWSRSFLVTDDCLIPRPETETLVKTVLEEANRTREGPLRVADVGTGCGVLAVTLACEDPALSIVASDISAPALEVARANARRHGVHSRIKFRRGSLLEPFSPESLDVLVSNPPYVSQAAYRRLDPEVRVWEPASALVAGRDGLFYLRKLLRRAPAYLRPGGLLACEVGADQREAVSSFIEGTGGYASYRWIRDLGGRTRVLVALREMRS